VRPERFELPTYCSGGNRSIHLSYGRPVQFTWGVEKHQCELSGDVRSVGARHSTRADATCQPGHITVRVSVRPLNLPAASATTATASAATVSAAVAASASTIASAASGVLSLRARFVHVEGASAYLRAVQRSNRFFSIFVAGHFYEAEAARTSGIAVGHDADPVDLPERFKHLPQFVFRCVKAQVPHENILQASASALSCQSASSMRRTWQVGDTFLKIGTGAGEQSNAARSIAGLSNRAG
jgi:hypothetical protein